MSLKTKWFLVGMLVSACVQVTAYYVFRAVQTPAPFETRVVDSDEMEGHRLGRHAMVEFHKGKVHVRNHTQLCVDACIDNGGIVDKTISEGCVCERTSLASADPLTGEKFKLTWDKYGNERSGR